MNHYYTATPCLQHGRKWKTKIIYMNYELRDHIGCDPQQAQLLSLLCQALRTKRRAVSLWSPAPGLPFSLGLLALQGRMLVHLSSSSAGCTPPHPWIIAASSQGDSLKRHRCLCRGKVGFIPVMGAHENSVCWLCLTTWKSTASKRPSSSQPFLWTKWQLSQPSVSKFPQQSWVCSGEPTGTDI